MEKATFTPLVYSTAGGCGEEAARFHTRLALLLSNKRGTSYGETIRYVRTKLSFCLLRAILAAVRGFRGTELRRDSSESDINTIESIEN